MRLSKIGKLYKIVVVRSNHIRRHFASTDEIEDDISHVIGEPTAIEEAL